jgi:peroxiredoxin family protein
MSNNLAIIFHSGTYDRVNHGLSLALASLAMGNKVRMFFTHLSLKYLIKNESESDFMALLTFSEDDEYYKTRFENFLREGHIHSIQELLKECKTLKGEIYVCAASMALLNITRDELIPEVDKTAGITTFLSEVNGFQILFI